MTAYRPAALFMTALLATAASFLLSCSSSARSEGGSNPVGVTVEPPDAAIEVGGRAAFAATVVNAVNTSVTWSVDGSGCGTVLAGNYTAPGSAATCYVRATSNADPTKSGIATVTVTAGPGGGGIEFHVGPGQAYESIGAVPWYALQAGDTVYIHYRSEPYREKFLISGRGTPSQWIRVLGVPGPGGELPIISGNGATTGPNNHFRWSAPNLVQWDGVIHVAVRADDGGVTPPVPGYIEIANLQVQDGYKDYSFTAENGASANYDGFAACIYARSVQHLVVRDSVLVNCGQGFYDWTGDGSSESWWAGLSRDVVLRGNTFAGNGNPGSYTEHQTYTEAEGVTIEQNRYGPQRVGALGSQLKDRSAGTVVRYNYFDQSPSGWTLDLVEPQEGWLTLGVSPLYRQAFIYGNLIVNRGIWDPNVVHWNEDHQAGQGRATFSDGRLFFYDNTLVTVANQSDMASFYVFNTTYGAYECPSGSLPGTIDVRNNIFSVQPRTAGAAVPQVIFGYCGKENFVFGQNWVSPGWAVHGASSTGTENLVSPTSNDSGFVNLASGDFHLNATSTAAGIGGALAPQVTSNALSLDLTPTRQFLAPHGSEARAQSGLGSDAGAFER